MLLNTLEKEDSKEEGTKMFKQKSLKISNAFLVQVLYQRTKVQHSKSCVYN